MLTLTRSFRRRFSSNTSSIEEPSSPGADARRPTLTTLIVPPHNAHGNSGMLIPLVNPDENWYPPSSRASTHQTSQYELAHELMAEQDRIEAIEDSRPFRTMADLCEEYNLFYPLEREEGEPPAYIDDVGGYNGPVMHGDGVVTSVRECSTDRLPPIEPNVYNEPKLNPVRKMSVHVTNAGRQARKWSGDLGRRASKLLRINMVPDLIRNKQREGFDLEQEWQDAMPQVDLGREVFEYDCDGWARGIERDFRVVEWR